MNKRALFCLLLTVVVGSAFAQDDTGGFKKGVHKKVSAASDSVTVAEAAATFQRVAGLFKTVLHIDAPAVLTNGPQSRPVTRAQVIDAMFRMYKAAGPAFTNTPKAVPVTYNRLRIDQGSSKPQLVELIQRGCIAPFGAIATNKTTAISVQDFGDAVGFFLSRIAEMTNRFDPKWTPYLKDQTKPG